MKKIIISILALTSISSCSNYYKAITGSQPENAAHISDLKTKNRYFILRNGTEALGMTNISFSDDRKNLLCTLETLTDEHRLHLINGRDGQMKYRKPASTEEDETAVLNEVHLYISPGSKIETGPYTLTLDKVQKTEIIEKDKIKTKKSYTMGTIIGISSAVVLIGGIAAIIIASTPIF